MACSPDQEWKEYVIDKGSHFSHEAGMVKSIAFSRGSSMRFKARFSEETLIQPETDKDDISKLFGFCDCNSLVHDNSIRIGWRSTGTEIEIYAYWYSSGKMGYNLLGKTLPGVEDTYELQAVGNKYIFNFNGTIFEAPRTTSCNHGIMAKCYPYFGGNSTSPVTMSIFIYEI